jgi:hypothetical protein
MPKKYYWACSEEAKLLAMFKTGLTDPKSLAEKFVSHIWGHTEKLETMVVVVFDFCSFRFLNSV